MEHPGIGQTFDTCWFYSALNLFLMSDDGFKIMWKKMREFYLGLSRPQRAFFNAPTHLACPFGNNRRQNLMDFWRFIDAYACAIGRPGNLPRIASNRTRSLLAPIQFSNAGVREAKGIAPAFAQKEIGPVLEHMGFENGKDFIYDYHFKLGWQKGWPPPGTNYKFIIFTRSPHSLTNYLALQDLKKSSHDFVLTGASIVFKPQGKRLPHAIAGFVQGRKGYIFDSAGSFDIRECKWWEAEALRRFIKDRYGKVEHINFAYWLYTNKAYTDKIAPFCRRKYKRLTGANRNQVEYEKAKARMAGVPIYNTSQASRAWLTPAARAALAKQYGKQNVLTKNAFNSLVSTATSFTNGMNSLKNLVRSGYTYNVKGNNFKNFRLKLLAKFPRPLPAFYYKMAYERGVRNNYRRSNQFYNSLANYALMGEYSINKNNKAYKNFASAVNRYTTGTRSAVKRSAAAAKSNNN